MTNPSDMLETIEDHYQLPEAYVRCIRFMLAGLRFVIDSMPAPVKDAAASAVDYWSNTKKEPPLEVAKVELWRHIDSGMLFGSAESGARAVLCVLEASPPTTDIVELLDWYLQFLRGAGAESTQIAGLISEYFPAARGRNGVDCH